MMMNETNYGIMDESSSSSNSYSYYSGDASVNHDQLRLMQLQEANDFADYDQAMYEACYDENQEYEYDYDGDEYYDNNDNDAIMWDNQQVDNVYYDQQNDDDLQDDDDEEEEDHDDSALLRLILGVQMYLGETTTTANRSKDDMPLMDLQYKMYTYMKQRAFELGMDTSSLY